MSDYLASRSARPAWLLEVEVVVVGARQEVSLSSGQRGGDFGVSDSINFPQKSEVSPLFAQNY